MNESHVQGVFDEAKGKLKQAFGEATGDEQTANSGVADQVKGQASQVWGNVKDTAHDLTNSTSANEARAEADNARVQAETSGTHLRDSIVSGAENLKNSITRGLDHLKSEANK